MNLTTIDWVIMAVYLVFVLGIGFWLRRSIRTSTDFFLSGRSIPAWVCGLAFISANLGAQEVIGMGASGAQYGIATSHFYWIGAIPAMVFVGIFMMPFYYGSRARSVPEYLKLRFDEKARAFNAITFAVMTVFSSGISMYAMAKIIKSLHLFDAAFAWANVAPERIFDASILISSLIVLVYIFLGGLTSAIYNEVLQFFLIVAGFLPLVWLGLKNVGGLQGLAEKAPPGFMHSWKGMSNAADNPMGIEWIGLAMGLGFVLSFGYWCTDFLVVQRAMAAESMNAARRTPLIAAVPKMLFPFLVIVPGIIAVSLPSTVPMPNTVANASSDNALARKGIIPQKVDEKTGKPEFDTAGNPVFDYTLATPNMLMYYLPTGVLGLGLTALLASFMSGMAGNVTAFNTVFTYDIYQSYVHSGASDRHYLWIGRVATVAGIALSVAAAYAAMRSENIMNMLQLVFGLVNAPLLATFLLGMFWKRATANGAFCGLTVGTLAAVIHYGLTLPKGAEAGIKGGWLTAGGEIPYIHLPLPHFPVAHVYYSEMAANFWTAIWAWSVCFVVTIVVSLMTKPRDERELVGLVYSLTERPKDEGGVWYNRPLTLGVIVLLMTVALNFFFR
ncbi:MAG TPA: sodium:solute symporter family protein [Lacipirellulaceae bacterium]|nr:sodium:solute symporter family protein [Lacipirellulaceae bacterium]